MASYVYRYEYSNTASRSKSLEKVESGPKWLALEQYYPGISSAAVLYDLPKRGTVEHLLQYIVPGGSYTTPA